MRIRRNLYLNFSSIPNLTKKARERKNIPNNSAFKKLVNFSCSKKFIGVEFPYFRFYQKKNYVNDLVDILQQKKLKYILDCEKKISKKELTQLIILSKKLKVKFIRLKCSNILSCQRHKFKNNWSYKINSIVNKIRQIKPLLKKYNVKLAIENHQDLDSNDLIYIIKNVGENFVGINFDIGNSFATCEMPKDFLKKTKKYILNIHLKDYIILPTSRGYGLYRCPILDGDSQILEIINLIKKFNLNVPISLELGAKTPRKISVKSKSFLNFFLYEKQTKYRNINSIMKIAEKNLINDNKIQKLISLNEINMLNKSLKNLSRLKI